MKANLKISLPLLQYLHKSGAKKLSIIISHLLSYHCNLNFTSCSVYFSIMITIKEEPYYASIKERLCLDCLDLIFNINSQINIF